MGALDSNIGDVEGRIAAVLPVGRDRALSRLGELFVSAAPRLAEPQIAVFDGVFGSLAGKTTASARAELAERLADLRNAPPNTVRLLALDEDVVVSRPVLVRSRVLQDADLIEVAHQRGADHMVAISGRRRLSDAVTDVLAAKGGQVVRRAIASNPGARCPARHCPRSSTGAATMMPWVISSESGRTWRTTRRSGCCRS